MCVIILSEFRPLVTEKFLNNFVYFTLNVEVFADCRRLLPRKTQFFFHYICIVTMRKSQLHIVFPTVYRSLTASDKKALDDPFLFQRPAFFKPNPKKC